jgi:hypothetical protein
MTLRQWIFRAPPGGTTTNNPTALKRSHERCLLYAYAALMTLLVFCDERYKNDLLIQYTRNRIDVTNVKSTTTTSDVSPHQQTLEAFQKMALTRGKNQPYGDIRKYSTKTQPTKKPLEPSKYNNVFPDINILGFAKSGTTNLYYILAKHPNMTSFASSKEKCANGVRRFDWSQSLYGSNNQLEHPLVFNGMVESRRNLWKKRTAPNAQGELPAAEFQASLKRQRRLLEVSADANPANATTETPFKITVPQPANITVAKPNNSKPNNITVSKPKPPPPKPVVGAGRIGKNERAKILKLFDSPPGGTRRQVGRRTVNACMNYRDMFAEIDLFKPRGKKFVLLFRDPADWLWGTFNFWIDPNLDTIPPHTYDWLSPELHYRSPELFHELIASGGLLRSAQRLFDLRQESVVLPRRLIQTVGRSNVMLAKSEDMLPAVVQEPGGFMDKLSAFTGLDRDLFDPQDSKSIRNCNDGKLKDCGQGKPSGSYQVTKGRTMLEETRQLIYLAFWEECKVWSKEFQIHYPACLAALPDRS